VHRRPPLTALAAALAATVLTGWLAACSAAPGPAPRAGEPTCTTALAAAPDRVLDRDRGQIDVRGALAWGEPPIVLRCGLPPLGPTTAQCVTVNDRDWVVTDPDADPVVFTSFGTDPAVEVSVPRTSTQPTGALVDLAPVAAALPANGRRCS
jgi:hypothetical protein